MSGVTMTVLFAGAFSPVHGPIGATAGVFGLTLLATPIALLTPLPLKIAVDKVIGDKPLPAFLDQLLSARLQAAAQEALG